MYINEYRRKYQAKPNIEVFYVKRYGKQPGSKD